MQTKSIECNSTLVKRLNIHNIIAPSSRYEVKTFATDFNDTTTTTTTTTTITTTTTTTTTSIQRRSSRFFLKQSPRCAANCLQHVRSWPRRNHVQITCIKSRAYHVQCVVRHVVRRDSSAIEFGRNEIAFILALLYSLKPLADEEGKCEDDPW